MPRITAVVESRSWRHPSGRTASIYGAHPARSAAERDEWRVETRGFTWECDDGTIGCCRTPAATREEAEAFMASWNEKLHGERAA